MGQYTLQLLLINKQQSTAGARVGASTSTARFVLFLDDLTTCTGRELRDLLNS